VREIREERCPRLVDGVSLVELAEKPGGPHPLDGAARLLDADERVRREGNRLAELLVSAGLEIHVEI
jgi:hypothetical protein